MKTKERLFPSTDQQEKAILDDVDGNEHIFKGGLYKTLHKLNHFGIFYNAACVLQGMDIVQSS